MVLPLMHTLTFWHYFDPQNGNDGDTYERWTWMFKARVWCLACSLFNCGWILSAWSQKPYWHNKATSQKKNCRGQMKWEMHCAWVQEEVVTKAGTAMTSGTAWHGVCSRAPSWDQLKGKRNRKNSLPKFKSTSITGCDTQRFLDRDNGDVKRGEDVKKKYYFSITYSHILLNNRLWNKL